MSGSAAPQAQRGPKRKKQRSVLGEALFEERRRQGITQNQIATMVGSYLRQVQLTEQGTPAWHILADYIDILAKQAPKNWRTRMAKTLWGAYEEAIWENEHLANDTCRIFFLAKALDMVAPERLELPTRGLGNRWTIDELMKAIRDRATEHSRTRVREPKLTGTAAA